MFARVPNPPFNDYWFQPVYERFLTQSKSGIPTVDDIPVDQWAFYKDSASGRLTLWFNDNGTLRQIPLASTGANNYGSNASPGYAYLPSGLSLQWGTGNTGVGGLLAVTFPIAFPTACVNVTVGESNAAAWTPANVTVFGASGANTTGFTAYGYNWNGAAFAPGVGAG